MITPNEPHERVAIVVLVAIAASVAAAVFLAPVMTVGWCADAHTGGTSTCHTEQRSLAGATAPWWLWVATQALIVAAAGAAVAARRRADR